MGQNSDPKSKRRRKSVLLYVQAHVLVHVWLPSQGYSVVMKKYKVTMSKGVGGQSELAVW